MRLHPFPILLLALVAALPLRADEVRLKNGDRLTGTVLRVIDGKLHLAMESAGEVAIDWAQVASFTAVEPVAIHLADGTILRARVAAADEDGRIQLVPEEAGREPWTVGLDEIKGINPPERRWRGTVTGGVTFNDGNTRSQSAELQGNAERRGERDRARFQGAFREAKQRDPETRESVTTERGYWTSLQYDWFLTERLYAFLNTRTEHDAVKDLDNRTTYTAGGGYQWFEEEDRNLLTEAGVTWVTENFANQIGTEEHMAARIRVKGDRTYRDAITPFTDIEWYPSIEDKDDHVIHADTGVRSTFSETMFTEFRITWDYDSTPAPGHKKQDTRYIVSIGWTF